MQTPLKTICVYCGSSDIVKSSYLEAATAMGVSLAKHGLRLVYGGGKTGLMGAVANSVLRAGGDVIGVIPDNFNTPELAHYGLTKLETLPDIQQRKRRMAELADAFIALPGGFGTLDELFETLTGIQVGIHQKPVGLLNTGGYFDSLLRFVDCALAEGFIYPEHRNLLICNEDPELLLTALNGFKLPENLLRWVERK